MKILHALFTPSLGGLEQAFVNISWAYARSGHELIGLVRPDAPYRQDIEATAAQTFMERPQGMYDFRAAWRIHRLIKRLQPDLILAHAPRAISMMGMAALGTGVPLCGMLHSYRMKRLRYADRIVVLTPDMRDSLVKQGYDEKRISIITNMVALEDKMVRPVAMRKPVVLGALGRLAIEKGFTYLLESVAILKDRGFDVVLQLGGDGPELSELRRQAQMLDIAKQVVFLGWVQDKAAFFSGLDIFCLPSLEESFGIVLLEAMSRGVPVISTATPGPRSIFTDEADALLVPAGNSRAMADAIRTMVLTPGLAQRIQQAALERVKAFRTEVVTQKWNELAELTVSEARARRG